MRPLLASALCLLAASAPAADGGTGPFPELRASWCPPGTVGEERSVTLPEGQFREVACTAQGQRVRTAVLSPLAHLVRLGELADGGAVWREHWFFANGQPWSVRTTLLPDRGAREDSFWPSGCRLGFTAVATRLDDPGVNVHTFFDDATPCLERLDAGAPLLVLEPAVSQVDHLETATRVHHLRGSSIAFGATDGGLGQACIGGTTVCHTWSTRVDEWGLEWSSGARWALVAPAAASDGGRDPHAVVFDVQRKSTRRLDGELIGPSRLRLRDDGGVLDLGTGSRESEPCEPGTEVRQLGEGFVCLGPQFDDVLALMQVKGEQKLNCAVRVKTVVDLPYAKAWALRELLTPGEPCASLLRQLTVYAPQPLSWTGK